MRSKHQRHHRRSYIVAYEHVPQGGGAVENVVMRAGDRMPTKQSAREVAHSLWLDDRNTTYWVARVERSGKIVE